MGEFTRNKILERLRRTIDRKEMIFAANCSSGMSAKYSAENGADLITVHSTGRYRFWGVPNPIPGLYWGGGNSMIGNVFELYHEMDNAVDDVPLVAGLEAFDTLFRKTDKLVRKAMDTGYDGIQNWPTWGYNIPVRMLRDAAGHGFKKEIAMIKMARKMDIFTMAYAFWPDDAKKFAEAGADVIIAHAGWTVGGPTGAPEPGTVKVDWEAEGFAAQPRTLDETVKQVQTILEAARSVKKEIIVLATGGSISTPENAQYVANRTDVHGIEAGHALEAIPYMKYLVKCGLDYKKLSMKAHPRKR